MDDISYKKYRIVLKSGYVFEVSARSVSVIQFEKGKSVSVQFQNPDHQICIEHLDGDEVAAVIKLNKI